jgi:methylenetetrahydrofolate dehydrogenase (NADP+)/methenyltetrahydrofolate cyclohydrolase
MCHTKTKDVASITKKAEIVVAAAGSAAFVKPEMLSPGQFVVDVGINAKPDGSGICGDVDPAAAEVVGSLTPVPGGVGSLTTTIIMGNLLKAIEIQGLG